MFLKKAAALVFVNVIGALGLVGSASGATNTLTYDSANTKVTFTSPAGRADDLVIWTDSLHSAYIADTTSPLSVDAASTVCVKYSAPTPPYNDILKCDASQLDLYTLDGDDTIKGGAESTTGSCEGSPASSSEMKLKVDAGIGNDQLPFPIGGSNATLYGGDGIDTFEGCDGDEIVHGGDGDDVLLAGSGRQYLFGEGDNDELSASTRDSVYCAASGGSGDDSVTGQGGKCGLIGGPGSDVINGGEGSEVILDANGTVAATSIVNGYGGDDEIYSSGSSADNVAIHGGEGGDHIVDGDGNASISGDAGNDEIQAGKGRDNISGGEGSDTALYSERSASVNISIDGLANDGELSERDNVDAENIETGDGDDTVSTPSSRVNTISTGKGDDNVDVSETAESSGAVMSTLGDKIDCGDDQDTLRFKARDTQTNCEALTVVSEVSGDPTDGGGSSTEVPAFDETGLEETGDGSSLSVEGAASSPASSGDAAAQAQSVANSGSGGSLANAGSSARFWWKGKRVTKKKTKRVVLGLKANGSGKARAKVTLKLGKKKISLGAISIRLKKNSWVKVSKKLSSRIRTKIRKALKSKKRVTLSFKASAKDTAGKAMIATSSTRSVRIKK